MSSDIGRQCGMLTVVEKLEGSRFRCSCACGKERVVRVGHFNAGNFKSCGCHVTRHGHGASGKKSRTYISYHNMIARCHNTKNKRYCDYGAKGIHVCERWRESFENFLEDMGDCPPGMTIDRRDNSKGYEPENCRWVDRKKNQRNRACSGFWVTGDREFETASEAARAFGVSAHTLRAWCLGRLAEGRWYPPKDGFGWRPKYPEEKA